MIKEAKNSNESRSNARSVGGSRSVTTSTWIFGVACFLLATLVLPGTLLAQNVISTVAGRGASGVTLGLPTGIATDAAGNFYIADTNSCVIWKVSNGAATVFAGTQGTCAPGTGSNPTLQNPIDVVSCNGSLYFATHGFDPVPVKSGSTPVGGLIYEVNSTGTLTTLPTPSVTSQAGPTYPVALACDANGNLFVSSYFYLAETSFYGSVDEIPAGSTTTQNLLSTFNYAYPGIAVDQSDNVYGIQVPAVLQGWQGLPSFSQAGLLVQLPLPGSNGGVQQVSGSGTFQNPSRLAMDGSGNFYITQAAITSGPTVYVTEVPAGGGSQTAFAGNGIAGYAGQGVNPTQAELNNATGMAVDGCGSLYIADAGNQAVRKVFNSATASFAPCTSGSSGAGGTGAGPTTSISLTSSAAQVTAPQTVSFYANVSISNCSSCTTPLQGNVSFCYAPAPSSDPCSGGTIFGTVDVNGPGNTQVSASLLNLTLPGGSYSVAATFLPTNGAVPSATSQPLSELVCGSTCPDPGIPGFSQPTTPLALTPGVLSTTENSAGVVAFDSFGFTYFLDTIAGTVTRLDASGGSTQIVGAGNLNHPSDMVIGLDGNLYITDTGNNRVVTVVGPAGASPVVSPIVFSSSLSPGLNAPTGIFATVSDTLYVTDTGNNRVVAFGTNGGFPSVEFSAATPGAPAIGSLVGIAVNPISLEMYIANAPPAGSSSPGNIIQTYVGGPASVVSTPGVTLQSPYGLALDPSNGLYFSDTGTHQIYRMDVYGNVLVVAGNGSATETGEGVSATQTGLANPTWIALDLSNDIWFTDQSSVREVNVKEALADFTATNQTQTIYLTSNISGSVGFVLPPSPYLTGPGSTDFMVQPYPASTCLRSGGTGIAPTLSPNTSCSLEVTFLGDTSTTYAGILVQSGIEQFLGSFNPATAYTQPILLNGNASGGPATLQITPASIPPGTMGSIYGPLQFFATGGTGQLTFSISSGALPTGLSLSSAGVLSGTPTQTGTFSFKVSASDTNGDSGSSLYSLTISGTSAPSVTGVTPPSGPASGGETVTISGNYFQNGATVSFGAVPATSVTFTSATSLSVVVPALSAGAVDVSVKNPDGQTATLTGGFIAILRPSITGVTPSSGPASGGETVTISGNYFQNGATVSFGAVPATSVTFISPTSLSVVAPALSAGPADVTVRNSDGQTATLTGGFIALLRPSITGVTPSSGPTSGGETVTISGNYFQNGTTVSFGAVPATSVTFISPTSLSVVAPALSAGPADVTVRNPDGQTATLTGGFIALLRPSITGVTPSSGPTSGETVTISGNYFQNGATVSFGAVPATSVTFISPTSLSVVAPALSAGPADVTVRNPDGQTATLAGGFVVLPVLASPIISGINPATGYSGQQGLVVTIDGNNFVAGSCLFSIGGGAVGITVVSLVVNSPTSATATLNIDPSTALGLYDVAVSVAGAPMTAILPGGFAVTPSVVPINVMESITVSDTPLVAPPYAVTGIAAAVANYSAGSIGFVNLPAGQTVTQVLTVSNVGLQPLAITGATITQDPTNSFSISQVQCSDGTSSITETIASGGECTLTISYTQPASGTPSGSITFTDNAGLSNLTSTASGSSFTQAVQLSSTVATTTGPAEPPTIVQIPITESINVNDQESVITLQSIAVTPANLTVAEGATEPFMATGIYSDGSAQNLTSAVTWSSSNTAIATMTGNIATAATGNTLGTLGTSTITAKLGTIQGSTVLTVHSQLVIAAKYPCNPVSSCITLGSAGIFVVKIAVTNNGNIAATSITPAGLLGGRLNRSSTSAQNVAPGATATVTLTFPASSGKPGTTAALLTGGIATSVNPNGKPVLPAFWSLPQIQVTLP